MKVYVVRTDVDYEIPLIYGYYRTRELAEAKRASVENDTDSAYYGWNCVIIEEFTLDQDIEHKYL